MIVQLRDYYAKSRDPIDKDDKILMDDLIKASELTKNKCSLEALTKEKERQSDFSGFQGNVIPYLRHYLREQFLVCKTKLESQLRERVASLNEKDEQEINKLRSSIAQTNTNYSEQDRYVYLISTAIEQGLATYFRENFGRDLSNVIEDERLYDLEFNRSVVELCSRVNKHFEQSMSIFDLFEDDSSILDTMSSYTIKWMENNRLCKIITSHRSEYF